MSSKNKNRAASTRAGKGKCRLCQQQFAKSKIEEHLNKCLESKFPPPANDDKEKYFFLKTHDGIFWMYLKASANATLQDVDGVLRKIWMECCGHLSTFNRHKPKNRKSPSTLEELQAREKEDNRDEKDENGLGITNKAPLDKLLKPGDTLDYAYDMGTTSKVLIDVLSEHYAPRSTDKEKNEPVSILVRNNHPMWECDKCDKTARSICSECYKHFCGKHGKKHDCDADMLLDVANSPRTGYCGYCGNDEDEGDKLDLPEEDDDEPDADDDNEDDEDDY